MPSCELCGKLAPLLLAEVESVDLKVCAACAKHGQIKKRPPSPLTILRPVKPEAPEFFIVDTYAQLLRSSREKKGLSQQDFARFLNEKESILAKWEAGALKPSIDMARMLERKLGLALVMMEEKISAKSEQPARSDELTLGDMVKVRKRK